MILPTSDESDRGQWGFHTVVSEWVFGVAMILYYSITMYWSTGVWQKRSTVVPTSITPVLSTRYSPALSDFVWPSVRNSRPHYTRTIFEVYLYFCTSRQWQSTSHRTSIWGVNKTGATIPPTHTHNKHYSTIPVFCIHQHEALG